MYLPLLSLVIGLVANRVKDRQIQPQRSYKTRRGMEAKIRVKLNSAISVNWGGQTTLLQVLFRLFEDIGIEQLTFRELFRVCLRKLLSRKPLLWC